jgi:UDP-N-acetylglucosamine 3-dehydrogenase
MNIMGKVATAVIGAGNMGRNHVRILSELDTVDLVGVADVSPENRSFVERKYKTKTYSDYQDMERENTIEAVVVAVPTKLHYDIVKFFLEKKIHVLVEKPITLDTDEAKELINLAKENNVILTVGHIERFNPAIIELKNKIQNGELGKIFKIGVQRNSPYPQRISDVGVVIDLAVHDIDIMRYLLNSEPVKLFAQVSYTVNSTHEDDLSAILRFATGEVCTFNINWLTPRKIRKLAVTGEKGMYLVDYINQSLEFHENSSMVDGNSLSENSQFMISEGKAVQFFIKKQEPLLVELKHYIQSITEGTKPCVSAYDGLRALEVAHEILQSSSEDTIIKRRGDN